MITSSTVQSSTLVITELALVAGAVIGVGLAEIFDVGSIVSVVGGISGSIGGLVATGVAAVGLR